VLWALVLKFGGKDLCLRIRVLGLDHNDVLALVRRAQIGPRRFSAGLGFSYWVLGFGFRLP